MKKIIAAIDFSEVDTKVIEKAAFFAQAFSSELVIIHVAAPDPDFVGYEVGPRHERDWRAKDLRKEHRDLQDKAEELRGKGLRATSLLVQGVTDEMIVKEAAKLEAELVVLGSHGHGPFYKALMGAVSEAVLQKIKCPVLIVPL